MDPKDMYEFGSDSSGKVEPHFRKKDKPSCSNCLHSHIYTSDVIESCILECSLLTYNIRYYKYDTVETCDSVSCNAHKKIQ